MIRVLLVDDHPVVRSGYLRLLEQAGGIQVVGEAGDGETAYAAFLAHRPDLLITDLSMPGGGGLELIRRVRCRNPEARALVFSMHDSALVVQRALDSGARGYVSKGSAPELLILAVRELHEGRRYLSPDLARLLQQHQPQPEAALLAELSAREFETFRLLAQGHSVDDCARELKLSPKTISNHQTSIKEKLGVATLAALAHLAMRHGVIGTPLAAAQAA
jgi:DNA-binding NarL/FixJ family response regulator